MISLSYKMRLVRRAASRSQRGFTLIEMLIAMVAGLGVALAVIALGRDATVNFQEEMRVATAQMTQRIAAGRLRSDLERVGFMGTGNIAYDPMIARTAADFNSGPPTYNNAAPGYNTATPGLANLVSIRLKVGGSSANDATVALYSALPDNATSPDQIELAGNFTTSDEYTANVDQPPGGGTGNCNGARIHLDPKDPATIRILYNPDGSANANAVDAAFAIFSPVTSATHTPYQFGLRVSDNNQTHYQFVAICDKADSIGTEILTDGVSMGVYVDTETQLMTNDQGTGGVVPGRGAGSNVVVSPLQVVRWEVLRRPSAILDAPAVPTIEALNAARFELVRTWVPLTNAPFANVVTASPSCLNCQETVAEFVVDLKFALSVYDSTIPGLRNIDLDDAANNTAWAPFSGFGTTTQSAPQARMIRFRLGTRAAQPDRTVALPAPNPKYLYRYCVTNAAPCPDFARVRETVTKVGLPNQSAMTY